MPGARHVLAPASPRSDAASGHDTDTPGAFQRGKRKYSHTTAAQRQCLLEWLELPGNFELLTKPVSANASASTSASTSTSSPAPKRVKKMDGYRSLAQYMNRVAHTDWSEKTARSRFESFMAAYRKAKRQSPQDLPSFYRRVDALFGPDGDIESRFRPESLGQRSEGSRSPLVSREHETVFQDLSVATPEATRGLVSDEQTSSSPPRRRARINRAFETVVETSTPSSPLQELTTTTSAGTVNDQALKMESQRLVVRQQELELKQSELRARQEEMRQKLRAEVLTRLVEAGKSPAEVREYLAIMDPIDSHPPTRR